MIKKILGNKKIIAVAVLALILVGIGAFAPLSIFGDGEYHTGISMDIINNCETEHHKVATTWWGLPGLSQDMGAWYGNIETDYTELINVPFDNGPVVTAIRNEEGVRSLSIGMEGTLTYLGAGTHTTWWWPDTGWYIVEVSSTGFATSWDPILNTKTGYIDHSIIGDVSGSLSAQKYQEEIPGPFSGIPGIPNVSPIAMCSIHSVHFNLKGPHVGAIRIRQMTEFKAAAGMQSTTETVSTDYCLMISGTGTVDIVDEMEQYVAGRDTVKFRVTTGYSGQTQSQFSGGPTSGWELQLYNNVGTRVKTWEIDDDKLNTRYDKTGALLDFAIPEDAVEPGVDRIWTAKLCNTLFEQDRITTFVITKEEEEQCPGIMPIQVDKSSYNLGDTVVITLEGIPEPLGRNTIAGFYVTIYYGKSGLDFIEGYDGKYITSSGNTKTISIIPSKGDIYITIEARAFDYPKDQGGLMSGRATRQIWIKEKESPPLPEEFDWVGILVVSLIVIIGIIAGIALPVSLYIKILIPIISAIVAIIVYLTFFTSGVV